MTDNRTSWSGSFKPDEANEPGPAPVSDLSSTIKEMVLRRELHLAKARILELELEKLGVKP